ncbi:MAG: sulfatase-like hydrolase/transferase [Puniceicoccales bacterium]
MVFFIPDQFRGDTLGHMGHPAVHTPHLDHLVETDGVSFSQAFCQNPVCTPSRCSFMTGWYPHTRGHRSMHHLLQADEPNLLAELRQAGYHVWWGGKNDLVTDPDGYARSYDVRHRAEVHHEGLHGDLSWRQRDGERWDYSFFAGKLEKGPGEDIYLDGDWSHVLAAEKLIRGWDSDQPLCVFLPLIYPHPPYGVEDPYFSDVDRIQLPPRARSSAFTGKPAMHEALRQGFKLEDRPESWWDELRATYCGMCARIDDQAGRILDALRESGRYDETAFFFFSDHGDFTGDYDLVEKAQNLFEDCITRVPFILKPPRELGTFSGIRQGLVELVDFSATVYELAGIEPSYTHFGRSVLPLLEQDGEHREAVFCSGGRTTHEKHCAVEGNGGHEKQDYLYYPRLRVQAGNPVAHGKGLMCRDARYKLVTRLYEQDELYDLEADPAETTNRIDDPALAGELERLRALTQRHLLETSDVVPWTLGQREVSDQSDVAVTPARS